MNRFSFRRQCTRYFCILFASFFLSFAPVKAQVIGVRTVPLLASEQFGLMPSVRASMGEVSIAFDDEGQDPFINPAKLRRMQNGLMFFSPAWKHWGKEQQQIFSDNYGARTTNEHWNTNTVSLPLGQLNHGPRYSGGFFFAFQILNERNQAAQSGDPSSPALRENDFTALNVPVVVLWAMDIPHTSFALGASVDVAYLGGAEAVSLLYPNFEKLEQEGLIYNFRLGVTGKLSEKDEISILAMQHNYRAHHEANRIIANKDQNHGWLGRVEYRRWLMRNLRAGVQLTGNWKTHPKIPDYPLSGVPRDPGTTHAYNLGVGLAWQPRFIHLALDAIYEPVTSKTWVEAEEPTLAYGGRTIARGEVTLRHNYDFSNRIFRLGVEKELWPWMTLRAGMQTKFFEFDYHHKNEITGFEQNVNSHSKWRETLWTAGASLRRGKTEWLYTLQVITGNGLLRRNFRDRYYDCSVCLGSSDFFIPPINNGYFSIDRVPIFRQQVSWLWHL